MSDATGVIRGDGFRFDEDPTPWRTLRGRKICTKGGDRSLIDEKFFEVYELSQAIVPAIVERWNRKYARSDGFYPIQSLGRNFRPNLVWAGNRFRFDWTDGPYRIGETCRRQRVEETRDYSGTE